jgi:mRNA interferase MazF
MTHAPKRGEVWLVDLGMVAKVRPCLVISIPADHPDDRVLTTLIPHTTSTRGSRFEVALNVRGLKTGAFDAQNIITIPAVKLTRLITQLSIDQIQQIENALRSWLGLYDSTRS